MMNFKKSLLVVTLFVSVTFSVFNSQAQQTISLNGKWLMGEGKHYNTEVDVPGIHTDPTKMNNDTLWYKRHIVLPQGNWSYATLELKGARFAPCIFVDGVSVSRANGGMTTTFHLLKSKKIKPGNSITLEVALTSLKKLPQTDASYIAVSDHWRSNISSSLWDDVILHLHGEQRIGTVIPDADPKIKKLSVDFYVENSVQPTTKSGTYIFNISDQKGKILFEQAGKCKTGKNTVSLNYTNKLKEWSPESPSLYRMTIAISQNGKLVDKTIRKLGVRKFETKERQLYLNGDLFKFRGSSFTWHRWMRTDDGVKLGQDTAWFKKNVVLRLKAHGANSINFHLGPPPSKFLDLCDRFGILVRYEWSFFHGMPATKESCVSQYAAWMAESMNHPSINMYYPYNETDGKELETAWSALDEVLKIYPPLVFSHRDILHVHKYWWSLFENLGLYYNSYSQFPQTVIADEFGGNYLNAEGNEGGYPAVKETFLRFLGRGHTKAMRLEHLSLSNGKIAEYWRRLGIAGWAPFTIMGSNEDGNNWFLGDLRAGNPMPVWSAMTASWSPVSVSLDIWDKNFLPNQRITVPIHFFNDLAKKQRLTIKITLIDSNGGMYYQQLIDKEIAASSHDSSSLQLILPNTIGDYRLSAELINRPVGVEFPIISSWKIRIFNATVPQRLAKAKVFIPDEEKELQVFVNNQNLKKVLLSAANVILLSTNSWNSIEKGDKELKALIETAINKGVSVVMLDAGPRSLGKAYPSENGEMKLVDGTQTVRQPTLQEYPLFGSISLQFKEAAEPETHVFPSVKDSTLWNYTPKSYTGMWNGLRGNLMLPAWEMEVQGVNADLFLEQWLTRGASQEVITSGQSYYAYEVHGYYEFSNKADDRATEKKLKDKVARHIEDAPSLAVFLDPNVAVKITDIGAGYKNANTGMAKSLNIVANAGKNLTKSPVLMIEFGKGKGNLLVSQLLTANRLIPSGSKLKPYAIRYDPIAVQTVLNMLDKALIDK
jgi:beta-galactosidase